MRTASFIVSLITALFISMMLSANPASAAGLCEKEATQAAKSLFKINTKGTRGKVKLVHSNLTYSFEGEGDEGEGAFDVYDIVFEKGGVLFAAYRIQVVVDGCQIIRFEIPFAS